MLRAEVLRVLKKGAWIPSWEIAKYTGSSRSVVRYHIDVLRSKGYVIDGRRNRGYKLLRNPDIPYPEEILSGINTEVIGSEIHYLPEVTSTNTYAIDLATHGNICEGAVVIAETQSQGHGRKGRRWYSPVGGLWFSVILYPELVPAMAMLITMSASVAVVEALRVIGINSGIKWPNDIMLYGKKVCGILTEIDADPHRINFAVIGIGINVNNPLPEDLKAVATTLRVASGRVLNRVKLFCSILECLDYNYRYIRKGDHEYIKTKWMEYSDTLGREVCISDGANRYFGRAVGIDLYGRLFLKTSSGVVKVSSGDLEYMDQ